MPTWLFSAALRRAGDGLAAVEQLAALCETSLTATAIRLTQCSRDPVAIVVSTGGHIDYCFMSDALKDFDGIDWIRKRQALPSNSATFAFNRNPDNVLRAVRIQHEGDLRQQTVRDHLVIANFLRSVIFIPSRARGVLAGRGSSVLRTVEVALHLRFVKNGSRVVENLAWIAASSP